MKHAAAFLGLKYAAACFELGEGNYQLLKRRTEMSQ